MATVQMQKESIEPKIAKETAILMPPSSVGAAATVASKTGQQVSPYWGDRIAMWIWAVSFLALAVLVGSEILFRQIHSLVNWLNN